jgi:hypothetical protein
MALDNAKIDSKLFGADDSAAPEKNPKIGATARFEDNGNDVVFTISAKMPRKQFLEHLRETKTGNIGFEVVITDPFAVSFKRPDGTTAKRVGQPNWRGLWVTIK